MLKTTEKADGQSEVSVDLQVRRIYAEATPDENSDLAGIRLRYPDGGGQLITPDFLTDNPEEVVKWIEQWMEYA